MNYEYAAPLALENRALGFGQFRRDRLRATAIREKENFDFASVGLERQQNDRKGCSMIFRTVK